MIRQLKRSFSSLILDECYLNIGFGEKRLTIYDWKGDYLQLNGVEIRWSHVKDGIVYGFSCKKVSTILGALRGLTYKPHKTNAQIQRSMQALVDDIRSLFKLRLRDLREKLDQHLGVSTWTAKSIIDCNVGNLLTGAALSYASGGIFTIINAMHNFSGAAAMERALKRMNAMHIVMLGNGPALESALTLALSGGAAAFVATDMTTLIQEKLMYEFLQNCYL